jgi:hypothetical protein
VKAEQLIRYTERDFRRASIKGAEASKVVEAEGRWKLKISGRSTERLVAAEFISGLNTLRL